MSRILLLFQLVISPALGLILALLGLESLGNNLLGWLLLLIGVGYAAGAVIVYWILREPVVSSRSEQKTSTQDAGNWSYWLVLPGLLVTFFVPPLEFLYFSANIPQSIWIEGCGIAFALLGTSLFVWAQVIRRRSDSGQLEQGINPKLRRNGPYHWIRHPDEAGCLLIAMGICIGYFNLKGLLAIPILLLPGLVYRIHKVEKSLAKRLGEQFRQYKVGTARLIPGVW